MGVVCVCIPTLAIMIQAMVANVCNFSLILTLTKAVASALVWKRQSEMKERNLEVENDCVSAIYELANGDTICVRLHKEKKGGRDFFAFVDVHTDDHVSEYRLHYWSGADNLHEEWSVRYAIRTGRYSITEVGQTRGLYDVRRALGLEVGLSKIRAILYRLSARSTWRDWRGKTYDIVRGVVGYYWGKPIVGLI